MKREVFLDINSNKLEVGNTIVYIRHNNLEKGIITRFTDKNIVVNRVMLSDSVSPFEVIIKAYNSSNGDPNTCRIGE